MSIVGGAPLVAKRAAMTCGVALACGLGCGDPVADEDVVQPAPAETPSACTTGAYPRAAAPGQGQAPAIVPDLSFTGEGGATVALHDYYDACAVRSRLLVLRESAAFCGTCAWHAAHTGELTRSDPSELSARIDLLDLLVSNADNELAIASDLPAWRAKIDAPGRLAVDPDATLHAAVAPQMGPRALPIYVLVDTKTMEIRATLSNPDPDELRHRIDAELARLDGAPAPSALESPKADGLFNREQWDMLLEMRLPTTPPPDPTNEYADDAGAAALGKKLFSDAGLSPSGTVSCATCHDPGKSFTDGVPQSIGVAKGDRNAPSVSLAAHARWQFWDGRADSSWAQALGPPEAAKELASSRLFVAHQIFDRYKTEYEAVFGVRYPLPDLADVARFPAHGKPGDSAYDAMSSADKDAVTRVYVNVGKAIAAFERRLRVQPNALDRYVEGDRSALSASQKSGLVSFFDAGCAQCHYGPRLTDDAFHNVRFPTGRQDGAADRGRDAIIATVTRAEFSAGGRWSDDRSKARLARADRAALGAFKTPSLRGVPRTMPYGHGGTLPTLADVVGRYGRPPAGAPPNAPPGAPTGPADVTIGVREPWVSGFNPSTGAALVELLGVLSAEVIVPE